MSLAFKSDETQEYALKSEIHYMFKVSYTKIADAIRDGRLAVHLIDNRIKINVAEAREVLLQPRTRSEIATDRLKHSGSLFE